MANKKILIIDDDPDILDMTKIILNANGFETITALDGNLGLESFKKENPDLVLCDMMMETVDAGVVVAGKIRQENKTVPIILLSSIGDATSFEIDTAALGFTGVFQKPFEPGNLILTIKKALG